MIISTGITIGMYREIFLYFRDVEISSNRCLVTFDVLLKIKNN